MTNLKQSNGRGEGGVLGRGQDHEEQDQLIIELDEISVPYERPLRTSSSPSRTKYWSLSSLCVLSWLLLIVVAVTTDMVQFLPNGYSYMSSSIAASPPPSPVDTAHFSANDNLHNKSSRTGETGASPQPPPLDSNSVETLMAKCSSWSLEFAQKFSQTCGFWIDEFQKWEAFVSAQGVNDPQQQQHSIAYWCNGNICGGWGDQVSAIMTAFTKAIQDRKGFQIIHDNHLEKLFSPCLFNTSATNWASYAVENPFTWTIDSRSPPFAPKNACLRLKDSEDLTAHQDFVNGKCRKPLDVLADADKAVLPAPICAAIGQRYPVRPISTSATLGCLLRANFEPSDFLQRHVRVPFWYNNAQHNLTLDEIERITREHYVISMHLRIGDSHMAENAPLQWETQGETMRDFKCVSTVEAHYAAAAAGNVKPVMWLLASDNYATLQMARQIFPDRVAFVDLAPVHIGVRNHMQVPGEEVAQQMVQWFVLGFGDQIVRRGMEHPPRTKPDTYDSGFLRSTWAFQLKDQEHESYYCTRKHFAYSASWALLPRIHPECAKLTTSTVIGREHLQRLGEQSFPHAWVDYRTGNVTTRSAFF